MKASMKSVATGQVFRPRVGYMSGIQAQGGAILLIGNSMHLIKHRNCIFSNDVTYEDIY